MLTLCRVHALLQNACTQEELKLQKVKVILPKHMFNVVTV